MPGSEYGIPSKSGSGGLIAIGVVALLGGAGLVLFKLQDSSGEASGTKGSGPETSSAEAKSSGPDMAQGSAEFPPQAAVTEKALVLDHAPPPPPSEEELDEKEGAAKAAEATTRAAPRGPAGCGGTCSGNAGSALRSALATRGAAARSCYNTALRRNENLGGRITVLMRLSPTGSVCSASVVDDTIGDPGVASCVASKFRGGNFPAPTGGCVDTAVPLNFTSH